MANPKYNRYYTYIKPVITNPFIRSYAPYIFSLSAMAIFIIFAIRPTVITILSLQKNLDENQQILATLSRKSQDLTDAKQNLDNLDPHVKTTILTRLPPSPAVTALIQSLQNSVTGQSSISALQIQPVGIIDNSAQEAPKQTISDVAFSMNIQGTFSQILIIIDNLHKSPRILNISNIVISKAETGSLSMSLTGKAYYLK
jgi:Tfp pilus assembly protein PilO